MSKFRFVLAVVVGLLLAGVAVAAPKDNKANQTQHTVKASARPFKALGHVTKTAAVGAAKFSFATVDAAVDAVGMGLQTLADAVDMFVAAPLESLPQPLSYVGDGVHYVYVGVDKVGEILAK